MSAMHEHVAAPPYEDPAKREPEDMEAATQRPADTFRCKALHATMSGLNCVRTYLGVGRASIPLPCENCPAGAARAKVLRDEAMKPTANQKKVHALREAAESGAALREVESRPRRQEGMHFGRVPTRAVLGCIAAEGKARGSVVLPEAPAITALAANDEPKAVEAVEPEVEEVEVASAEPTSSPAALTQTAARRRGDCRRCVVNPADSITHPDHCATCVKTARRAVKRGGNDVTREAVRAYLKDGTRVGAGSHGNSTDWDIQPLGRVSDTDIARALGLSPATVRSARMARGIAACPSACFGRKAGVDWDAQPLGIETDAAIARRIGVSEAAARNARVKRGIQPAPRPNEVVATCARQDCGGAIRAGLNGMESDLPEFCVVCRDEARTKLRRKHGESTADERRAWLTEHPRGSIPTGRPPKARPEAPTQPLPTVTVEPAPEPAPSAPEAAEAPIGDVMPLDEVRRLVAMGEDDDGPDAPAPVAAETPAPRDDEGVAALRAERDEAVAAAERLQDQVDREVRECRELRRDLKAALESGAKWRRLAEKLAALLTETMGVVPEGVGRG